MQPATVDEGILAPGSRLGSYRIVRALGSGAFGAVYEAIKEPLGRRVALKALHAEMTRRPEAVARFLREAELVARLEHPHVVGVFDVGAERGVPYLTMEFLEGETLQACLVREGAQPAHRALALMLPILSALATVHEEGVVHRDLKPDNIFLARQRTGEVQPKLLDFGIAKILEGSEALTRTNAMMGTPLYMSPEQVQESKDVGAASDQWSLGVILYRCVAGCSPFTGGSLIALLNAIAVAPLVPLRAHAPATPEGFEGVVFRALERDPARRHPSVREFALALLPFADVATQARWAGHFAAPTHPETDDPMAATAESVPPLSLSSTPPASPAVRPSMASAPLHPSGPEVTPGVQQGPAGTRLQGQGTLQPQARTLDTDRQPLTRRPRVRLLAGAVGATVLAGILAAVAAGRSPAVAPVPAASVPTNYALVLRVEPATASIEFDGQPAGTGAIERTLPRDGREHRLQVHAAGYESALVSFRDAAPPPLLRLGALPDATAPEPLRSLARSAVAPVHATSAGPLPRAVGGSALRPGRRGGAAGRRAHEPQGLSAPRGFAPAAPLAVPTTTPSTATGTNNVGIM